MGKQEFGIIGLGKFGLSLARALVRQDQIVVGVDNDADRVKQASELLHQAYQADAMDKVALQQMGFGEFSQTIVSTGHSMEASILITLFLKEIGCPRVTVKAISTDHQTVLQKVGADEVIFPEQFAAEQLAAKLAVPGLIDYLPLGRNVLLKEITVDEWAGSTLRELNLTNEYGIQVVAVKAVDAEMFVFVPRADQVLRKGDVLAIIGHGQNMAAIEQD